MSLAQVSAKKTLSIIIPVYNEEKTVSLLLDRVRDAKLDLNKEIIIVNDGSRDKSPALIKKWLEANTSGESFRTIYLEKPNGGKGSAVRHGIEHSTGDVLIIQDADLEYSPEDYEKCVRPILDGEVKVVYGSRELYNHNRVYSSPSFYLGGLTLTYWMNLLYGCDLTDEPTCYKTFDGNLIRTLLFKGDKFDWEPEITAKLLRLGYRIKEVTINYTPRKISEGKKIKWTDGVAGLWEALYWRFAGIGTERRKLSSVLPSERTLINDYRYKFYTLAALVMLAFAVRLFFALPGIGEPEKLLFRPDTASYLGPAQSLLHDGTYSTNPGSGTPAVLRVPGYSAYLAALAAISGSSLSFCVIISCLLGALICVPLFYTADYITGWKTGSLAVLLFLFNITAIALSPMFLSDTLFTFILAVQLYFFIRFYYSRIFIYLLLVVALAAFGALVRPINQFWIFPCLVLILAGNLGIKKKLAALFFAVLIFGIITGPWIVRNKISGAGWRLDAIAGDVIFHNGAVLLSKINGKNQNENRANLMSATGEEFKNNPALYKDEDSRIKYKEKIFIDLVKTAPFTYFTLHFRPYILFPDAPSLLQNLGVTTGERGTFDILSKHGVLPAIKHYFDGKYWYLFILTPLLLIVFVSYLGAFLYMLRAVYRKDWFSILIFLAFIEFYLFVPGPVNMPRYQLPALPLICIFAAAAIVHCRKYGFGIFKN